MIRIKLGSIFQEFKSILSAKSSTMIFMTVLLMLIGFEHLGGLTKETKEEMIRLFNGSRIFSDIESVLSKNEGDEYRQISWGVSDGISSMLKLYEVTGNKDCLIESAEYLDRIIRVRDIERGVISYFDYIEAGIK